MAVVVSMWVIPISILVNRIVPHPYMDEIFHIPQVRQYCNGNFRSWDPMITTPPGMYGITLAYVASFFPFMWFAKVTSSFYHICSTPVLRSSNGALAIICSLLIYDILIHLKPALSEKKASFYAITIALYPVHWFFTFLYYTDIASVAAILATYLASLKQHYWTSAIFGAMAVLIRQTNVVWMGFIAATAAIEFVEILYEKQLVQSDNCSVSVMKNDGTIKNSTDNPTLRRRKWTTSKNHNRSNNSEIKNNPSDKIGIGEEFHDILIKLWCFKWNILTSFTPFIIVLVSFLSFVIWNGSIVLGAKEAHVVSPHFAQIMYVGLVSAAATAPVHFCTTQVMVMFRSLLSKNKARSLFLCLIALIAGFLAVHFYSIAHPYLLADNRHYTFYIWRKIINKHWSTRYFLVPIYVYSWFSLIYILAKWQKKMWILLFFLACSAVLVPAPLIEFRYYTIPFFFLVLHSGIDDSISWMLIASVYIAVDIFTIVIFLYHPFQWSHEPGTQRFIW